jgi:tryptophan 7-halogenase
LLIGKEAWEDWSHWLPCDRAVAAPCKAPEGPIEPFTRAIAMPAGWRWRIPLRHRIGNGYVYSSAHCTDEAAADALMASIEEQVMAPPRILRFRAGRRRNSWVGNVVAIGLASGFLEPLESTSIYLAQMAITGLLKHLPSPDIDPIGRNAFNREVDYEYDRIRDFLILHYHATTRNDSPFWDHVRTMTIPDSLSEKIALWRSCALVPSYRRGLFLEPSWISVMIGQGIVPDGWDPRAELARTEGLGSALNGLAAHISRNVQSMPMHAAMLAGTRL